MTNAILTPLDFSAPVKAGRRRFWKQILPVTSINYEGTPINFDHAFHKDLDLAFKGKAYDQVPIVFADAANGHNMDPRNFAGEVIDMENRGKDGTWALIEADRAGARAIAKNPKLGVSARIIQGINKADGRTFKRAVNHVLLTMNPRVSGMEPWQAVDLSEDADIQVVDLTAENYEEGSTMGKSATKSRSSRRKPIDLSALSDDEFNNLLTRLDLADEDDDEDEVDPDDLEGDGEDGDDEGEGDDEVVVDKKPGKKKSRKRITIEKESEGEDDDDDEDEDGATDLSDALVTETRSAVRTMQIDLAETRWASERSRLVRDGVPPYLLDLAEPILASPDAMVLDLSDGESEADVQAILRKFLKAAKGQVDLSDEAGHSIDLSDGIQKDDPDAALLSQWDEQYS